MPVNKRVVHILSNLSLYISISGILIFLYEIGYGKYNATEVAYPAIYIIVGVLGITTLVCRMANTRFREIISHSVMISDIIMSLLFIIFIFWSLKFHDFFGIYLIPVMVFVREASVHLPSFNRKHINPAKIFVASFLLMILLGAVLLEMPNATPQGITFVDALFTSASAVCVTGLNTLSTHSDFTVIGRSIILLLIQIGGLGIMTIAVYFARFFRGKTTYENRIIIGQVTGVNRLAEVTLLIRRIILITFTIELMGAIAIFLCLPQQLGLDLRHRLFFSVFHSISAFCNAGFSTLDTGLAGPILHTAYSIHWIIALLIILGGIGFFVIDDVREHTIKTIKYKREIFINTPIKRISNTSRIVLITTGALLAFGTIMLLLMEWNGVLSDLPWEGKITAAFFQSTTCRTAGFNTIDITQLSIPGILLMLFLMWVGASPASTGGGIKTTAIAVAMLTIYNVLRGRDRVEVFHRKLTRHTIYRAFSVVILSIMTIIVNTCLLSITEPRFTLTQLLFETTSAYGTVGLSLGVTPLLSEAGKYIVIFTMFTGRVTMLTLLMSLVPPAKIQQYKCPKEEITIS
ncbi:TrkH family potassium uptake protein [Porphyromonas pogonae]|uniref:TrkH family potassium uptake protein n=1 Tax=Porphyromonas pogonae TaxID=867595 RepID=UPI002E78B99C|nr:potassium transporter TrkG [Porphyromonas pogonae]